MEIVNAQEHSAVCIKSNICSSYICSHITLVVPIGYPGNVPDVWCPDDQSAILYKAYVLVLRLITRGLRVCDLSYKGTISKFRPLAPGGANY